MAGSARGGRAGSARRARALVDLWRSDRDGFEAEARRLLAAGDDAALDATIAGLNPNEASEGASALTAIAEAADPGGERLFAIPLTIAPGRTPQEVMWERVRDALAATPLVPKGCLPRLHPTPVASEWASGLTWSRRRTLAYAISSGGFPGGWDLPAPPVGGAAVLLGTCEIPEGEDVPGLPDASDAEPVVLRRTLLEVLKACAPAGVIDVGIPSSLADASEAPSGWLVAEGPGPSEIRDFVRVAAAAGPVGCVVRRNGTLFLVSLVAGDGSVVDARRIDPWSLPVTPHGLGSALAAEAAWVRLDGRWQGKPEFLSRQPPPPRPGKPVLRIVSGEMGS